MSAQPSRPSPPPQRTVVLVGARARMVCEAALRTLEGVALVRAPGPLDALGEVFHPIAQEAGPPLVVVSDDALAVDEADAFSRALRSLDGRCALRWLSETGQAPPGFPAALTSAAAVEALLRELQGDDAAAPTEPAQQPDAAASDAVAGDAAAGASGLRDAASVCAAALDASPLTAVLQGESPLQACLGVLERLLGGEVRYTPNAAVSSAPAGAVAVQRHGRRFGWLAAPQGVQAAVAVLAADWLAAHLALDAQARALRQAAFTDELTGAWNRRYFNRFLESALERARQRRTPVTLLVFDIDDFKSYNDRYGHAAGDTILQQTVKLLQSDIRPSDRVCRIGGDEFAVVFDAPEGPREPGSAPPSTVAQIAERFQRRICEHRFPELAELAPGTLTISGGLATFPWDAHDAASLLRAADELALRSKQQGKNHLTFGPGAEQVCRLQDLSPSPPRRSSPPPSASP